MPNMPQFGFSVKEIQKNILGLPIATPLAPRPASGRKRGEGIDGLERLEGRVAPLLPARGQKVGKRGRAKSRFAQSPTPLTLTLSPQAGRGNRWRAVWSEVRPSWGLWEGEAGGAPRGATLIRPRSRGPFSPREKGSGPGSQ
jgi:hypothetical protein